MQSLWKAQCYATFLSKYFRYYLVYWDTCNDCSFERPNIQQRKYQLSVHDIVSANANIISTLFLHNGVQKINCIAVQKKRRLLVVCWKRKSLLYVTVIENINSITQFLASDILISEKYLPKKNLFQVIIIQ